MREIEEIKPPPKFSAGARSLPVGTENQDSLFFDEQRGAVGVFDGVGGLTGGAKASQTARDLIRRSFSQPLDSLSLGQTIEFIRGFINSAHKIQLDNNLKNRTSEITTAVVGYLWRGEKSHWISGSMGDSRAYLLREGKLVQKTSDRAVGNVLTTGIGYKGEPDMVSFEIKKGDRVFLCSDGVPQNLLDDEIQKILTDNPDDKKAAEELVSRASKSGKKQDDITAVVITPFFSDLTGEPAEEPPIHASAPAIEPQPSVHPHPDRGPDYTVSQASRIRVTNGSLRRNGVRPPERRTTLNRRKFGDYALNLGKAALVGLPLGGIIYRYGSEETGYMKNGIPNEYGIFFPLYGNITTDEIPQDLDIIFKDKEIKKEDLDDEGKPKDPIKLLMDTSFQTGVLENLANQGTRIVYGNVIPDYAPGANWAIPAAEAAAALSLGVATRRNFLGYLFAALAVISMGRVSDLAIAGDPNKNGATRTALRLGGRTSAFHPENRGIYLADAKMAHAMIVAGNVFRFEGGRKPKVGINVGGEHNNVEEFLKDTTPFLAVRSAITNTPVSSNFLPDFVKNVGGLDNFCSAFEITLPQDFQLKEALNEPKRRREVTAQIKVRRYKPDDILVDQLKAMGLQGL